MLCQRTHATTAHEPQVYVPQDTCYARKLHASYTARCAKQPVWTQCNYSCSEDHTNWHKGAHLAAAKVICVVSVVDGCIDGGACRATALVNGVHVDSFGNIITSINITVILVELAVMWTLLSLMKETLTLRRHLQVTDSNCKCPDSTHFHWEPTLLDNNSCSINERQLVFATAHEITRTEQLSIRIVDQQYQQECHCWS